MSKLLNCVSGGVLFLVVIFSSHASEFHEQDLEFEVASSKKMLFYIESSAVTARNLAFSSFICGLYQLDAMKSAIGRSKRLHGAKAMGLFIPAYFLTDSYYNLYKAYEIQEEKDKVLQLKKRISAWD